MEIDYTNVYCPLGCCRPVEWIDHDWVNTTGTEKLVFLGTESSQEADVILDCFDENRTFDYANPFFIKFKREPKLKYVDRWSKWRGDKPLREVEDVTRSITSNLTLVCYQWLSQDLLRRMIGSKASAES
jgi:hypothetical protein